MSASATQYNVYATNSFYTFNQQGEAYLSKDGLTGSFSPEQPGDVFQYKVTAPLSGASVAMIVPGGEPEQIHVQIIDQAGTVISGTESLTNSGNCLITRYTFDSPVTQGDIVYKITYSGFDEKNAFICNAAITM